MKISFYAVGWQAPQKNQLIGAVKNFRQAKFSKGFEGFLKGVQFANEPSMSEKSVIKKFNSSINSLENTETNGNNTAVPFFRQVTSSLSVEFERISKIETQLIMHSRTNKLSFKMGTSKKLLNGTWFH